MSVDVSAVSELMRGMIAQGGDAYERAYDRVAAVLNDLDARERVYVCALLGAHTRHWMMSYGLNQNEANALIIAAIDQAVQFVT